MKKQINSKTVWFNVVMFIMFIAPVNTYLNPNQDIDTDNVHPTNQGHRHIFESFKLVTQ